VHVPRGGAERIGLSITRQLSTHAEFGSELLQSHGLGQRRGSRVRPTRTIEALQPLLANRRTPCGQRIPGMSTAPMVHQRVDAGLEARGHWLAARSQMRCRTTGGRSWRKHVTRARSVHPIWNAGARRRPGGCGQLFVHMSPLASSTYKVSTWAWSSSSCWFIRSVTPSKKKPHHPL